MNERLQDLLTSAGHWLLPVIGLASLIEYLFPPFPGDFVTIVGTYFALENGAGLMSVYLVLGIGAVLGPPIDYSAGRWIAPRLRGDGHPRLRRWVESPGAKRADALFRRWGVWLILINRFLPGGRSLVFVLAGITRVSFVLTMVLGVLSGLAWNAAIVFAMYELGLNADTLLRLLHRVTRSTLLMILVAVAVMTSTLLGLWLRRHRRRTL